MNVLRRVCAPIALALLAVCAGCTSGPDLAGRTMTPYQQAWSRIIRSAYPRWKPPAYPPVIAPEGNGVLPPAVAAPAPAVPPAASQEAEIVPLQGASGAPRP